MGRFHRKLLNELPWRTIGLPGLRTGGVISLAICGIITSVTSLRWSICTWWLRSSDDIIPKNIDKDCYSKEQWKQRQQHIEANGLYADIAALFSNDKIKGKSVCVACRRVGHTADSCRQCKFGTAFSSLTDKFSRNRLKDTRNQVGRKRFDRFVEKRTNSLKRGTKRRRG